MGETEPQLATLEQRKKLRHLFADAGWTFPMICTGLNKKFGKRLIMELTTHEAHEVIGYFDTAR